MAHSTKFKNAIALIAEHHGGQFGMASIRETKDGATFRAQDGMEYEVTLPGKWANLRSCPDGAPFKYRVPAGRLVVHCWTDAPDAWWVLDAKTGLKDAAA